VACFPARAVAGCSICCLPKETTINFHIRMMPIKREHRVVAWTPMLGQRNRMRT
jgi:hypothetical protein